MLVSKNRRFAFKRPKKITQFGVSVKLSKYIVLSHCRIELYPDSILTMLKINNAEKFTSSCALSLCRKRVLSYKGRYCCSECGFSKLVFSYLSGKTKSVLPLEWENQLGFPT